MLMSYLVTILLLVFGGVERLGNGASAHHPPENTATDECRYDAARALTLELDAVISEADPMLGAADARVTVVEFFDPNCIHCRRLHPVMQDVFDSYRDRIRYYRKPFALSRRSVFQVAAMLIAKEDGKFFEMMDRQLEHPDLPYLSNDQLEELAGELGLDRAAFRAALESEDYIPEVEALKQQARSAHVRGTPTVVINSSDHVVAGSSQTEECIRMFIEQELAAASE